MDGWMDGWMERWIGGWMHEAMQKQDFCEGIICCYNEVGCAVCGQYTFKMEIKIELYRVRQCILIKM
jgi:hypothetical protein